MTTSKPKYTKIKKMEVTYPMPTEPKKVDWDVVHEYARRIRERINEREKKAQSSDQHEYTEPYT